MKRIVLIAVALLVAVSFIGFAEGQKEGEGEAAEPAEGKTYKMTLSSYSISDTSVSGSASAFEYFKEKVEERTDGAIEVKTFYNSSLGGVKEVTRQTMDGKTVQSSIAYGGVFTSFFKKYQLMYTPYLFYNWETAWNFLDSDYFAEFISEAEEETGLRVLGIMDDGGGFVAFTNNKRLIKTPDDMKGLRIRVEKGNAAQEALIKGLGADAVPLPWGDVTTALASGVADGQFNAPYVNSFSKFWEVTDYSSWTKFIYNTAVWSVSEKWFEQLPKEYQDIILETADEAMDICRDVNSEQCMIAWEEAKEKFEDTYLPSEEVMAQWKEKLRPIYRDWITEDYGISEDLVNEFWNAVAEVEKNTN